MPLLNYMHWFVKRCGGLALLIIGCVVLYAIAGRFPAPGISAGQISPSFWPRAILLGVISLCVLKMANLVIYHRSTLYVKIPFSKSSNQKVLVGSIFMVFGYVFAIQVFGFFLSCLVFLWGFTYLGGWRRKIYLSVISIVGAISITYLFVKVIYIPLPRGLGVFHDFSILIYRALGIF